MRTAFITPLLETDVATGEECSLHVEGDSETLDFLYIYFYLIFGRRVYAPSV